MKEILIIRQQNNQLGDLICTIPLYKALKKKFPDSHISLITAETNYPVSVKEINPYVDKIFVYKKDNFRNIVKFYKDIRREKYDITIIPSTLKLSRTSYIIGAFVRSDLKVGVKKIDDEKNKLHFLVDVKGQFNWRSGKVHQIYRILDIGKMIDCSLDNEEINNTRIELKDDDEKFGVLFFGENFPDKNKPVFGFHPGAGKVSNIWGTEKYFELIYLLNRRYNPYILITTGEIDLNIKNKLTEMLSGSGINFVSADNLPVLKLASVLKRLNLYVTNDTGVMHLAAYAGTRTLSLFGPTSGYEWAPLFNEGYYIQSDTGFINDIQVGVVFKKIIEIIEQ